MKKMLIILPILLLSSTVLAKGLGKHVHGAIKLEIAVEGKTIEIELDGPAESFIGFEYLPKTENEKKTFKDAESLWTKDLLTKLFIFDQKLGCTTSEVTFEQEIEEHKIKTAKKEAGIHSEIEAKAKIICAQDLKGQPVSVSVKKHYPHIKKLSIDLIGSETKSIEAKATEVIKL